MGRARRNLFGVCIWGKALGQGFGASWALNFSSRLNVFFAMSDGQAVPRRHDVEETISFSIALLSTVTQGFPVSGLCTYRSGEGREGLCLEVGPPAILEGFGHQNGFKRASKNPSKNKLKKKRPRGAPGTPQGAPRGAQEAKKVPKWSQKAPKRAPKIDDFWVRARN